MAKRRLEDEAEVLSRVNAQAEAQRQAAGLGPSIYEQMWRLLDGAMDSLMTPPIGNHDELVKGQALGIAQCLAIIGDPLVKDVDDVRAMAVERWQARQKATPPTKRKPARRQRTG